MSTEQKLREAAENAVGCLRAAEIEGLQQALAETQDEHLKDLVQRRLLYAFEPLSDVLAQPPAPEQPTESVLIDGKPYTIPAEVAAEILGLCIALKSQPGQQAPQGWKLYGNRTNFERYAAEQGYRDFELNEFDGYKNSHTQARWNFWRAGQDAMLAASPAAPEAAKPVTERAELIQGLLRAADEIAKAGHNGWGNTCAQAAALLSADSKAGGEPVVWADPETLARVVSGSAVAATLSGGKANRFTTPLYAHPQQQAVSLTDEQWKSKLGDRQLFTILEAIRFVEKVYGIGKDQA